TTYWCTQAQTEFAEPVKTAFAKKHLDAANAAKGAGKADVCSNEVAAVLALDPGNADAQAIQCSPEAKAPVEKREGPSQADKNKKAAGLGDEAFKRLVARDLDGAAGKAREALK